MAAAVPVPSPPWRAAATAAIILTHPSARSVGHGATAEAPSGVWFSLILLVLTLVALILWMHRRQQLLTVAAEQDRRVLVERMKSQEADRLRQREEAAAAEREQALLSERQRLMQDMHDGLGSSLTSAIRSVERGAMNDAEISGMLKG